MCSNARKRSKNAIQVMDAGTLEMQTLIHRAHHLATRSAPVRLKMECMHESDICRSKLGLAMADLALSNMATIDLASNSNVTGTCSLRESIFVISSSSKITTRIENS